MIRTHLKTKSEAWTYKLLKSLGYSDNEIEYPDVRNRTSKDVDFLVPELAIEVKELVPSQQDKEEEKRIRQDLRSGRVTTYWVPPKISAFSRHIKDANRKFDNYTKTSTLLIIDMEWGLRTPDIESLVKGTLQLVLSTETTRWSNRPIRPDTANNISAILVKYDNQLNMYNTSRTPKVITRFTTSLRSLIGDRLYEFNLEFGEGYNILKDTDNS